jgi:hypothetical protein
VLAPGFEPSQALANELQEHVKRLTAPYKYPREIEFIAELPRQLAARSAAWTCDSESYIDQCALRHLVTPDDVL